MARVVESEIERLQAEVSIERLVGARGVRLERAGGELVGRCPFHADEGRSLLVDVAENSWRCRGSCATGGSVVEWVMRSEGVSQRHAVEFLRAGMAPVGSGSPPRQGTVRRLASPLSIRADGAELLGQVVAFYQSTLKASPEALGYMQERGLVHPELIDRFRIGYANRTLGYRLPAKNRKEGAELRGRLAGLGVLRDTGHEHFRGALTIPICDSSGTIVQLYGRRVGRARQERNTNTSAHLWLPGERRGVWNADVLAASAEVILAGSLMDGLTFWSAGFRHVTATWGPEGFTADHADALRSHGVRRVLIAFRRPDGDRAAGELAQQLGAEGVECFRVVFPRGADANDVAVEAAASAADVLGRALRAAVWMGSGPAPRRGSAPSVEETTPAETAGPHRQSPPGARLVSRRRRPSPQVQPQPEAAPPGPTAVPEPVEPGLVSPLPPAPVPLEVEMAGAELRARVAERRWRVRGLERVSSFDSLRLNVLVGRADPELGDLFYVDTLDLYSARSRAAFVHAAAGELRVTEEVLRADLGRMLLACEERATEAVAAAQAPKTKAVTLSEAEEKAAMELLRAPDLVDRICADFVRAGFVGEATNALVGYLAAVSRKLDEPLAVLVQSMSAAGKSALMDAVVGFVPPEDRVQFSAITGQSLFYMGEADLAHKLLALVEEQGGERAAYALKLLQSEGELSIASTGKETASGRLTTRTYRVAGPVALFMTTTAADVDEELANRCLVLTVDEDRAQTRAIHAAQRARQTLDGLRAEGQRRVVLKVHHDAQRLLEPVAVINPYAPQLGFADERTRHRRDHMKYLTLIRAIALLHQHQRSRRRAITAEGEVEYVEVVPADIALANRLAHEVLGRCLDELAPQTRRLLDIVAAEVDLRAATGGVTRAEILFTRREVRAWAGWSDFQVRIHLGRLVELEYVLVHRGGRGQSYLYELLWDGGGTDGRPHLAGLVGPDQLQPYGPDIEHHDGRFEGSSSPHRALVEAPLRAGVNGHPPGATAARRSLILDGQSSVANGSGAIVTARDR
jgi:DNA primase